MLHRVLRILELYNVLEISGANMFHRVLNILVLDNVLKIRYFSTL